jgi:hypothetical protein
MNQIKRRTGGVYEGEGAVEDEIEFMQGIAKLSTQMHIPALDCVNRQIQRLWFDISEQQQLLMRPQRVQKHTLALTTRGEVSEKQNSEQRERGPQAEGLLCPTSGAVGTAIAISSFIQSSSSAILYSLLMHRFCGETPLSLSIGIRIARCLRCSYFARRWAGAAAPSVACVRIDTGAAANLLLRSSTAAEPNTVRSPSAPTRSPPGSRQLCTGTPEVNSHVSRRLRLTSGWQ